MRNTGIWMFLTSFIYEGPHYSALDFVVSSFFTHSPGMEKNPHNLKFDLKKHALKSFTSSKVRKILRIVEQEKNNWILIFLTSLIREGLDYPGLDPVITSFPMHSPGIQNTTYNLKFLMEKIPSKMT